MKTIRIATRGSALALAQSGQVAEALERRLGVGTERVVLKTTGDRLADVPLAAVGGKGLFIKEIEEALLDGRADLAVHSAKDLPAETTPRLVFAAFPQRADPRDALLAREADARLATLPAGTRVGTGSLRRRSQLLARRPELVVESLRGNVDTRLAKLDRGEVDVLLLACAGLDRLGLGPRIRERIAAELLLPAVGQGALALQVREGDALADAVAALDHAETRCAVLAERAFLQRLAGDCTTPLAAQAELLSEGRLRLRGLLASPDGKRVARGEAEGSRGDPAAIGRAAAEQALRAGASEILAELAAEPAR